MIFKSILPTLLISAMVCSQLLSFAISAYDAYNEFTVVEEQAEEQERRYQEEFRQKETIANSLEIIANNMISNENSEKLNIVEELDEYKLEKIEEMTEYGDINNVVLDEVYRHGKRVDENLDTKNIVGLRLATIHNIIEAEDMEEVDMAMEFYDNTITELTEVLYKIKYSNSKDEEITCSLFRTNMVSLDEMENTINTLLLLNKYEAEEIISVIDCYMSHVLEHKEHHISMAYNVIKDSIKKNKVAELIESVNNNEFTFDYDEYNL